MQWAKLCLRILAMYNGRVARLGLTLLGRSWIGSVPQILRRRVLNGGLCMVLRAMLLRITMGDAQSQANSENTRTARNGQLRKFVVLLGRAWIRVGCELFC